MSSTPTIKHDDQFLTELAAYLEGDIPDELRALIEQHLAECGDCRIVVDTLRQTLALYERLPGPDLPPAARARLYRTLALEEYLKHAS